MAISASRSVRPVDEKGSTVTKSTVPAIVDFKPSIGKRVTVRMPDSPAVSFAQLSVLPAPSDVTTPMPVTTTIGLPNLSRGAVMISPVESRAMCLLDCLDQGHALALPVAGPDDDNLGRRSGHFNLQPGRDRWAETARRARSKAPPAQGRAEIASPACGRTSSRSRAPQGRGAALRNAFSSDVTGSTPVAPVMSAPCRRRRRASTTALPAISSPRRAACVAPGRRPRWSAWRKAWRRAPPRAPWIRSPGKHRPNRARSRCACPCAHTGANLSFRLKSPNS